jgi:dihydropteroate synthase
VEFTLKINNKKLVFIKPIIMGILNVNPDSFYDGGKFNSEKDILFHVEKMIGERATIIDIGAASTRPGAEEITEKQELERLLKVLNLISFNFPDTIISVDTYRSFIARKVIENGAHIINDISGGTFDTNMFEVIAEQQVPYIMMHIQGTPKNMQQNPQYKNVVNEIKLFFQHQLTKLKQLGVTKNIILDPGFGFGKTLEHNYELLYHLNSFKDLGYSIMAGVSRKSMINKVLKIKPQNALNGTTILNTIALLNGANILRVHDVKEAAESIKLVEFYNQTNSE